MKKKESSKQWVIWTLVILGLVAALFLYLRTGDTDTKLNEALTSLFAETFGAILTAFTLDRYLKRREDKRRSDTEGLLYRKVLQITEEILGNLISPAAYGQDYEFRQNTIGDVVAPLISKVSNYEIAPNLIKLFELYLTEGDSDSFITLQLTLLKLREHVSQCLDRIIQLPDSPTIAQFMRIEDALESVQKLLKTTDPDTHYFIDQLAKNPEAQKRYLEEMRQSLTGIAIAADKLRIYLREEILPQYFQINNL